MNTTELKYIVERLQQLGVTTIKKAKEPLSQMYISNWRRELRGYPIDGQTLEEVHEYYDIIQGHEVIKARKECKGWIRSLNIVMETERYSINDPVLKEYVDQNGFIYLIWE